MVNYRITAVCIFFGPRSVEFLEFINIYLPWITSFLYRTVYVMVVPPLTLFHFWRVRLQKWFYRPAKGPCLQNVLLLFHFENQWTTPYCSSVVYKYGNVLLGIYNILYYSITSVLLPLMRCCIYIYIKINYFNYHLYTWRVRLNNILSVFAFDSSVLLDLVLNVSQTYNNISICS